MSRYSDYTLQAMKLQPMAYWELNSSYKEFSSGEAFNYLSKINSVLSPRSLVFGGVEDGINLDTDSSVVSIPMPACCPIGKAGKEKRNWTINFLYQHLSDTFSTTTPIFKIGTDLELYFSGQKFYLNLRGKYFYVSVDNYKDLFHISIINNKDGGNLIINQYQAEKSGEPNINFSNNTSMVFSSDGFSDYQVSNLSMYNRELSGAEIKSLQDSNVYSNEYLDVIQAYDTHILGGSFYSSDIVSTHSPSPSELTLRNCSFSSGSFYLPAKPLARAVGVSYSETGASFSSSDYLYLKLPEISLMDSKVDVYADFSGVGTLYSLSMNTEFTVSVDAGDLVVSDGGEIKYSEAITGDYISVAFFNGLLLVDTGSGYVDTEYSISTSQFIEAMYVGNDTTLTSGFSSTINSVSINYYQYPIPVGLYKLDLNYDYGSSEFIKPQQGGVGLWSVAMPYEFATTSVDFVKKSNYSYVKTFTDINLVSDSLWFMGLAGTDIYPGTSAKSYSEGNTYGVLDNSYNTYAELLAAYDAYSDISEATESAPISPNVDGSSVIVKFSVVLQDTENSSSSFVKTAPGISNLSISSYSTNTMYSENSILELTSEDQDAFIASELDSSLAKKKIGGFKIFNDSDIVISEIPSGVQQINIRMLLDKTIVNTGNHEVFNIDDTFIVSMNKSLESYTLSANSGTLYVNGSAYSGETLTIYNDYLISYVITSGDYTSATFRNMAGFIINSVDFSTELISAQDISDSLNSAPYTIVNDSSYTLIGSDFTPTISIIDGYSIASG